MFLTIMKWQFNESDLREMCFMFALEICTWMLNCNQEILNEVLLSTEYECSADLCCLAYSVICRTFETIILAMQPS